MSGSAPAGGSDPGKPVDVAVIGGGPAGASAARLLAAWGHSVLVLTKSDTGTPSLAESLPPSCRKVFEAVGVREAIERAGFLMTGGNTVCWDGGPPRVAAFGGGRVGHQVLRRDFDRLLLAEASRAGARVRAGVTVRDVALAEDASAATGDGPPGGTGDGVRGGPDHGALVTVTGRDEHGRTVTAAARTVLDCSGRAGIVARRYRTRVQAGETTLALIGVWQGDGDRSVLDAAPERDGAAGGDGTETVVEAYADGWAWSVPAPGARRYVTVMVDPRTTEADRANSLAARYLAELGKTTYLARLARGATLDVAPWALDASQYGARRFGGPGFLLVGDAATFIDPLSSFGVKKAMASGWLAAVATNTCLRHPARAALARDFQADRERQVWESYRRQAAAFFAEVSRRELHPFWSDRADPLALDARAGRAGGTDAVEAFRRSPAVRAAFEALRRAPSIRLRPTGAARTTTVPLVEGREIVAGACLSLDAGEAGVVALRHLRGVDLPGLLAMAGERTQVPDLYALYRESHPPVDLADFLGALAVLLGTGLLRNEAGERPEAGNPT